jgi:hypothetical protein
MNWVFFWGMIAGEAIVYFFQAAPLPVEGRFVTQDWWWVYFTSGKFLWIMILWIATIAAYSSEMDKP